MATVTETASDVNRHSPGFGILSLAIPLLGVPLAFMMLMGGAGGSLNAFFIVIYLAMIFGSLSATAAFIRWEKYGILPLLGFLVNSSPFYLFFGDYPVILVCLYVAVLFCGVFAVMAIVDKERGRTWALYAAIPPALVVLTMTALILWGLFTKQGTGSSC